MVRVIGKTLLFIVLSLVGVFAILWAETYYAAPASAFFGWSLVHPEDQIMFLHDQIIFSKNVAFVSAALSMVAISIIGLATKMHTKAATLVVFLILSPLFVYGTYFLASTFESLAPCEGISSIETCNDQLGIIVK